MNTIFGNRLKELRIKKGLLQKQVSFELGIKVSRYSSYESNSRFPELSILIKIADYYNVSIDYLIGRDNKTHLDNEKLINELEKLKNYINSIQKYIKNSK